ncbi:HCNGP domain-containing protein [Aspergillus tanneri]|uniref:HCNGP-like protein n=1 Tax=Aspergillus tanneri TaxID=1220188 RepID=A0A5M9MYT1_9EURO|nr:uncharacterized protein ATNIH1004_001176 [Aspergillus tanneri]KAA8652272.1 hypothetical protein ATNIH1004_001176 [Aspergillus tanneri]
MLGLGAYESSSEDEVDQKCASSQRQVIKDRPELAFKTEENKEFGDGPKTPKNTINPDPSGPVLGPLHQETHSSDIHSLDGHSSPYSTSHTLVHDLTLPPVPNLDIPPSPPGTPNPTANAKFAHFLTLKEQEVHFNEKLASSTSLKNQDLLVKLMDHMGLYGQVQYYTSLPLDLWDTSCLPSWGFKEELLKTQKETRNSIEDQRLASQRDTIGFVNATSETSHTGTVLNSKKRLRAPSALTA